MSLLLLLCSQAWGQQLDIDHVTDTFCSPSDIAEAGSANVQGGGPCFLELTDGSAGVVGAGWFDQTMPLGPNTSFQTFFHADIYGADGTSGRTGLGFMVHNDSGGITAVGNGGSEKGVGGMSPSLAVFFDTYNNPSDELQVLLDGNTSWVADANVPFEMREDPAASSSGSTTATAPKN